MDVKLYWDAVIRQDKDEMLGFFNEDAYIRWHNTNEQFTVEQFIRANCEYPGEWDGEIERIENISDLVITVTRIWTKDRELFFHVVSFIKVHNNKISSIDEYWGDDGKAPKWRVDLAIGEAIAR
jgi:hypothetical protein